MQKRSDKAPQAESALESHLLTSCLPRVVASNKEQMTGFDMKEVLSSTCAVTNAYVALQNGLE